MKHAPIALLAGLLSTAALAQSPNPTGPLPTRMQFCQQEVQGLAGDERRAALRTCLVRRAAAEPLVKSECRAQISEVPAEPAVRQQLQHTCEYRALSVPSAELPKPLAPIPSQLPDEMATPPAEAPARAAEPAVEVPAGGADNGFHGGDRSVSPVVLPDPSPDAQ